MKNKTHILQGSGTMMKKIIAMCFVVLFAATPGIVYSKEGKINKDAKVAVINRNDSGTGLNDKAILSLNFDEENNAVKMQEVSLAHLDNNTKVMKGDSFMKQEEQHRDMRASIGFTEMLILCVWGVTIVFSALYVKKIKKLS